MQIHGRRSRRFDLQESNILHFELLLDPDSVWVLSFRTCVHIVERNSCGVANCHRGEQKRLERAIERSAGDISYLLCDGGIKSLYYSVQLDGFLVVALDVLLRLCGAEFVREGGQPDRCAQKGEQEYPHFQIPQEIG